MKAVIFLGPSLQARLAHELCREASIDILPPARMGDIFRAVERGATLIGLIDGLFEQTPAVWHKEVLYAIDRGVTVIGGSSMGALRAAELHSFGMVGAGRIFDDFASGALEDDDEVTVVHGTDGEEYTCHSEAMVNLRYGLRGALQDGAIDASLCEVLIRYAKAQFYPERCWDGVLAQARRYDVAAAEKLAAYLERVTPNQKRDDAIAVIETMLRWIGEGRLAHPPRFHFEPTRYWDEVVSAFGAIGGSAASTYVDRVTTHVRVAEPERVALLERGLMLHLAMAEAKRCNIVIDEIDARTALEAFRRARGLNAPDQLLRWMADNDVDQAGCLDLARLEQLFTLLERQKAEHVDRCLLKALKLSGKYRSVADHAAAKWNSSQVKEARALLGSDEATLARAFAWYQDRFGSIAGDLEDHAAHMRLSVSAFYEEILVEYLFATEARSADAMAGNETAQRIVA